MDDLDIFFIKRSFCDWIIYIYIIYKQIIWSIVVGNCHNAEHN